MADLYKQIDEKRRNTGKEVYDKQMEREANRDLYNISVPDELYAQWNKAIAGADDPAETAHKFGTALRYSDMFGVNFEDALANIDTYNDLLWGHDENRTYKSNWKAVCDSWKTGQNSMRQAKLGNLMKQAIKDGDEELQQTIWNEWNALNDENETLSDTQPRFWAIEALKAGAQSTPYTAASGAANMFGQLVGTGLLKSKTAGELLGSLGTVAASTWITGGQEYMELLNEGIRPEIAGPTSLVSGVFQGGVEAVLGESVSWAASAAYATIGKSVGKGVSKSLINSIVNSAQKKWHFGNGVKLTAATVLRYFADIPSEGLEEGSQGKISSMAKNVAIRSENTARRKDAAEEEAKRLEELDYNTGKMADEAIEIIKQEIANRDEFAQLPLDSYGWNDAWNDIKGGMLGAIVLGIPSTGMNIVGDARQLHEIKKAAQNIASEKVFTNEMMKERTTENGDTYTYADVLGVEDTQDLKNTLHDIYEAQSPVRNETNFAKLSDITEINTAEEGYAEAEEDPETGETIVTPVSRTDTGSIAAEDIEVAVNENGTVQRQYRIGDTTKENKNLYGYIDYTVDEKNKTITIDKFSMDYNREGIRQEVYDQFAEKAAGYDIIWNAKSKRAKAVKEYLTNYNPSGKKSGLTYYKNENDLLDRNTRKSVAKQIKENIPSIAGDNQQVAAAVAYAEAIAKNRGESLNDWINRTFAAGKVFGSAEEFKQAAEAQGESVENKRGGQQWKKFGNEVKAVIYAGEKADFSTWIHELSHVWQQQLSRDAEAGNQEAAKQLAQMEKAFNVINHDWNNSQFTFADGTILNSTEALAYGAEQYLMSGKANNGDLKELYSNLAQFISRVYNALKNFINFNQDIIDTYENYLKGDDSMLKLAEEAVVKADKELYYKWANEQQQAQKEAEQQDLDAKKAEQAKHAEYEEVNYTPEELEAQEKKRQEEERNNYWKEKHNNFQERYEEAYANKQFNKEAVMNVEIEKAFPEQFEEAFKDPSKTNYIIEMVPLLNDIYAHGAYANVYDYNIKSELVEAVDVVNDLKDFIKENNIPMDLTKANKEKWNDTAKEFLLYSYDREEARQQEKKEKSFETSLKNNMPTPEELSSETTKLNSQYLGYTPEDILKNVTELTQEEKTYRENQKAIQEGLPGVTSSIYAKQFNKDKNSYGDKIEIATTAGEDVLNDENININDISFQRFWHSEEEKQSATNDAIEFLNNSNTFTEKERKRIKDNMEKLHYKANGEETGYYIMALDSLLLRRDIEDVLHGIPLRDNSWIVSWNNYKLSKGENPSDMYVTFMLAAKKAVKDPEAAKALLVAYLARHKMLGTNKKAEIVLNGSILNCNPSKMCAEYCYVFSDKLEYSDYYSMAKSELVNWYVELEPAAAADRVAYEYEDKRNAGYALRLFDKGDIGEKWVPFIKRLNEKHEQRLQIFSKRPEIFSEVNNGMNLIFLSKDQSNREMCLKYPGIPKSVYVSGPKDLELIKEEKLTFIQEGGVILFDNDDYTGAMELIDQIREIDPRLLKNLCPYQLQEATKKTKKSDTKTEKKKLSCLTCQHRTTGCWYHDKTKAGMNDLIYKKNQEIIERTEQIRGFVLENERRYIRENGLKGEELRKYTENNTRLVGELVALLQGPDGGRILSLLQGADGQLTTSGHDGGSYSGSDSEYDTGRSLDEGTTKLNSQLLGELGATNLDRAEETTIRMDNKSVAEQMEAAGKDPYAIRVATGWERGADGKWRYEIPDFTLKEKPTWTAQESDGLKYHFGLLQELIDAPELFAAYPELKKYSVQTSLNGSNTLGQYSGLLNMISLNNNYEFTDNKAKTEKLKELYATPEWNSWMDKFTLLDPDNDKEAYEKLNDEFEDSDIYKKFEEIYKAPAKVEGLNPKVMTTLVHEVQHAIQELEGFAVGGGPETARKQISNFIKKQNNVTFKNEIAYEQISDVAAKRTAVAYYLNAYDYDDTETFRKSGVFQQYGPFVLSKNKKVREEQIREAYWKWNEEQLSVVNQLVDPWERSKYIDMSRDELKNTYDKLSKDLTKLYEQSGDFIKADAEIKKLDKYTDYELYNALAGEVESRNVEKRLNWDKAQRMQTLLAESEDIARDQQRVLFQVLNTAAQEAASIQEEEVRKQYEGTENWLKAPNGKDSNLTEKQWIQVRTPNFIQWFGDWQNDPANASKVVDENGEPLVMYRGQDWEETGYIPGDFVSTEETFAEGYGTPEAIYVNSRNPFNGATDVEQLRDFVKQNEEDLIDEYDYFFEGEGYQTADEIMKALKENWWIAYEQSEIIANEISKRGYDSIWIQEDGVDNLWLKGATMKSANINNGDFNANDDRINFQTVYHGTAAQFDKFDTKNYGLSGEGSMSFGYGTYLTNSEAIARDYAERQYYDKFTIKDYYQDEINRIGEYVKNVQDKYDNFISWEDWKQQRDQHIEKIKSVIARKEAAGQDPTWNKSILKTAIENSSKVNYIEEKNNLKRSIETAKNDIKALEQKKAAAEKNTDAKKTLLTVDIPDNGFIQWDKKVRQSTLNKINEALFRKLAYEPNEDGEYSYRGVENELRRELNNVFNSEYTGNSLYGTVAAYLGSDKNASEFLHSIGYTGNEYPAGTNFGTSEKDARNFVIFDDFDAKIVDKLNFQTLDALYKDALMYDTWEEFKDAYEMEAAFDTDGTVDHSQVPSGADDNWYKTTWEMAKAIVPDESMNKTMVQLNNETNDTSAVSQDQLFTTQLETDPEMLKDFMLRIGELQKIDFNSQEYSRPADTEEQEYFEHIASLQDLINTRLSDVTIATNAKRIANGEEVSKATMRSIMSRIKNNVREYRSLYSQLMDDPQWAVDEADLPRVANAEGLKKYRLVSPNEDLDRKSIDEIRRLSTELENREIREKAKNGTLTMGDEDSRYIKLLEKDNKRLQEDYDGLVKSISDDFQRISDAQTRRLLELHEQLMEAKENYQKHNDEVTRLIDKGLKVTGKYANKVRQLKFTYDDVWNKYDDLYNTIAINDQVKKLLSLQEEKAKLKAEIQKKQDEKAIASEIKKYRVQLVKRAMRRVPFDKVDYEYARTIIAIQRMLEPNLMGGVNRWIGTEGPYLRNIINNIITDPEYKNDVMQYLNNHSKDSAAFIRFKDLLNNTDNMEKFNEWTEKDREAAIGYLPKEDWIRDLNLKKLAKEREDSIDIDINRVIKRKPMRDKEGNVIRNSKNEPIYAVTFDIEVDKEIEALVRDAVGDTMYNNIVNRPFAEWTMEEMEQLSIRINQLYRTGADARNAKKVAEVEAAAKIRMAIENAVKNTGIVINDDDTPEVKAQKEEKINKILGLDNSLKGTSVQQKKENKFNRLLHGYADATVLRVARILDNYKEGENVTELFHKENKCYEQKQKALNERAIKIQKVMQENNIDFDLLNEQVEVNGRKFTIDDLLYFLAADADYADSEKLVAKGKEPGTLEANDDYAATSRNAVMFGTLLSSNEDQQAKEFWAEMDRQMQLKINNNELTTAEKQLEILGLLEAKPGTAAYIQACKTRYREVIAAAMKVEKEHPELKVLREAIAADYAEQYDRLNQVSIEEFNQPVHRTKCYVPLSRQENNGDVNANKVKEDLLASSGSQTQWVDKGMSKRRVNMAPLNQQPIVTGLYKTWNNSAERTEHFIAYAGYVRELNRVYKSYDSKYTRRFIESRYGKGMMNYIDQYINETANPDANNVRTAGDAFIRTLRGKTAPAYLAWKLSAIVKQGCTSPWPYMQFVSPAEYLAASWKMITSKGELYDAVRAKSVFMNNRTMDPMNDLVTEMLENAKNGFDRNLAKVNATGMKGLEWIDWISVAPGWYACYLKKLDELNKNNTEIYENEKLRLLSENTFAEVGTSDYMSIEKIEALANQAMQDEVERLAVEYADQCTRECQPSSRAADIAPLFKNSSEAMKAYLQFQTSLNVIWNNIRYDLPYSVKTKQFGRIIGMVAGYALAGIMMNAVMEGWHNDDDDDKETEKAVKDFIWYSTTQFTDSVPVLGSTLTTATQKLITGKAGYFGGSGTDMTPMVTKFVNATTSTATAIANRDDPEKAKKAWLKAASNFTEGLNMNFGLPVSGLKEVEKLAGIGDGDGQLGVNFDEVYGILKNIEGKENK